MFHTSLINDPFGDPGVYLGFKYRSEALLFDLGDLHPLYPRQILKIGSIFISHMHMDHFIGFDQLLRICLGRDKHIRLFGPPGILRSVENRIASYTWNLVENYTNDFAVIVTEVEPRGGRQTRTYRCRTAFRPEEPEVIDGSDASAGLLTDTPFFSVRCAFLDHRIDCLAFRFEEKRRINVKKTEMLQMGLAPGPWLMHLKEQILAGSRADVRVTVPWTGADGVNGQKEIPLGELSGRIVRITPGRSVAYVTDAVFSDENAERIVEIAAGAEVLFIEATFLERDRQKAAQKFHLTAHQAGTLARRAGVKRIELFHFSPKYKGMGETLIQEANAAFAGEGSGNV